MLSSVLLRFHSSEHAYVLGQGRVEGLVPLWFSTRPGLAGFVGGAFIRGGFGGKVKVKASI